MGVNTKSFDNASDMITFSRASGGYGLTKVSYGPELVTNGDFATDSDWTKGTGWSICWRCCDTLWSYGIKPYADAVYCW